jgi:hypothetical protein
VKIAKSHWNKDFLDEFEVFPQGSHDDQVDACSLAFNKLATKQALWVRAAGTVADYGPDSTEPEVTEVFGPMGRVVTYKLRPERLDIRPDAPGWIPYHRYRR